MKKIMLVVCLCSAVATAADMEWIAARALVGTKFVWQTDSQGNRTAAKSATDGTVATISSIRAITNTQAIVDAAYDYDNPSQLGFDQLWPILNSHPATNEIPRAGMTYRIAETNGVVTWWIARTGDMIATQLSAHDANGNPIISSVDLKTGTQTTITTDSLPRSSKKAKQKGRP
jgi:hypothetical protein